MALPVSKSEFAEIVEFALRDLPEQFATALEEVRVEVRDSPTPRMRARVRLGSRDLLLGLYEGRPITQRSVEESGRMPDVIYLFQSSIEEVSGTREQLIENIRSTVLHELGHHYGLDEDDLNDLGYG